MDFTEGCACRPDAHCMTCALIPSMLKLFTFGGNGNQTWIGIISSGSASVWIGSPGGLTKYTVRGELRLREMK